MLWRSVVRIKAQQKLVLRWVQINSKNSSFSWLIGFKFLHETLPRGVGVFAKLFRMFGVFEKDEIYGRAYIVVFFRA